MYLIKPSIIPSTTGILCHVDSAMHFFHATYVSSLYDTGRSSYHRIKVVQMEINRSTTKYACNNMKCICVCKIIICMCHCTQLLYTYVHVYTHVYAIFTLAMEILSLVHRTVPSFTGGVLGRLATITEKVRG